MSGQSFQLHPYEPHPSLQLTGTLERQSDRLLLHYCLVGPLHKLHIPPLMPTPQRRDNLWQSTCFECFIGQPRQPQYWEVNLSCTGDWNVYRFDDYRQGMAPEPRLTALPCVISHQTHELTVDVTFNLDRLGLYTAPLTLAIATVLQSTDGNLSYWALTHPAPTADFHHRGSFRISC